MTATSRVHSDIPRRGEGLVAGLAVTAVFVPAIAASATVLAYLLLPQTLANGVSRGAAAIATGLGAAAVIWLVIGAAARPMASAQNAQPRFLVELRGRHQILADRLRGYAEPETHPGSYLEEGLASETRREAEDVLDAVAVELAAERTRPALRWALGYGYTSQLRELHRAAELLILIEPPDDVVGDALDDDLSLEDSTIEGRDRLRGLLRAAIGRIAPCAPDAFKPFGPGVTVDATWCVSETTARHVLSKVHHAVKDFRDDRRDGLFRTRNNIVWSSIAVALPAYMLLGLALIESVPQIQVVTATTFYLVGAAAALFQRLGSDAKRDTAVDDLGLYQARLVTTHVLSGLAAIAGVYLVIVAPVVAGAQGDSTTALSSVFDLTQNQIGLVYAAIFGLTPAALTGRLDQQAKKLTGDLAASAPATGATK